MTGLEQTYAGRLARCNFAPATWDKRFARDMASRPRQQPLSLKQAQNLWRLVYRYRVQMRLTTTEQAMAQRLSTEPDRAASPPVEIPAWLLRPILERPEEDGPRLVCADWLEENGHGERGEFIRAQCELARTPCADPDKCFYGGNQIVERAGELIYFCGKQECLTGAERVQALYRRERELLDAHMSEWIIYSPTLNQILREGDSVEFARGFIYAVGCDPEYWRDRGPEIVAAHPVTLLRIRGAIAPDPSAAIAWARSVAGLPPLKAREPAAARQPRRSNMAHRFHG